MPAGPLDITGHWAGRWQSSTGRGGAVSCTTRATGRHTWVADFYAECGGSHQYTVKLEGKLEEPLPGREPAVLFAGEVDLGKDGLFHWTGKATPTEFDGIYRGGSGSGTFRMIRAAKSPGVAACDPRPSAPQT
jgi:hypothetical protein